MNTKFIQKREALDNAVRSLKEGGLVVFPTETVYGLGAHAFDEKAVSSIFTAKGRPPDNPLIVHIHDTGQVDELCVNVSNLAYDLWERFSPGPLTLILPRKNTVPSLVSAGLDTIAIRIPSHPTALELLRQVDIPVAAPSANVSGKPSPTDFAMAREYMEGKVDYIIDGGRCEIGLESTVVLCRHDRLIILRPGKITRSELKKVAGSKIPVYFLEESNEPQHEKSSPGTRHPHYKPEARVEIVTDMADLQEKIKIEPQLIKGLLTLEGQEAADASLHVIVFSDIDHYARNFYKNLQDLDRQGVDVIYCLSVDEKGVGHALMNRMRRAAGLE